MVASESQITFSVAAITTFERTQTDTQANAHTHTHTQRYSLSTNTLCCHHVDIYLNFVMSFKKNNSGVFLHNLICKGDSNVRAA